MFRTICAVFYKNRKTSLRAYPWSFIISRITGSVFSIIFPLFIYHYIFMGSLSNEFLYYTKTSDYVTFIILGESLNIMSFATLMNVGRCIITEIREGTLESILISPTSRIGYFIGSYIEQLGRSTIEFLLIIIVGLLLGARIQLSMIINLIIILILSSLSFFSISIMVSSVMVFTRDTYIVQNTVFTVMSFICGVAFPINFLPNSLQLLSNVFPLTPAIKLFRSCIINGQNLYDEWILIVQMLLLSIFYMLIGLLWFKKLEKKYVEKIYA